MVEFYKMSGSGNDFILIDNRDGSLVLSDPVRFVRILCERKGSVGADGVILIGNSPRADFRWRFFNADGSEAEMCGNGGRCAARFAFLMGIAPERMTFETLAGIIDAEVKGPWVKLRLTDPKGLSYVDRLSTSVGDFSLYTIDTGVPHAVCFVEELDSFDVLTAGRAIRFHDYFQPAGTNADFVKILDTHSLKIRTYERGVEDETLACGTGSVAAALVAAHKKLVLPPVEVLVRSGEKLKIYFEEKEGFFRNVYLEGSTKVVYQGKLWEEALR